ncbi:MAG: ornithine decarboxylase [Gammaproteobacteria bacterium]
MTDPIRTVIYGANKQEISFYQSLVDKHGSPLLLFDSSKLKQQYRALQQALPNVDLFYAIKALPQIDVLKKLDELEAGFDVASSGELDILLSLKVGGRRTIHTHPVKSDKDIRDALRFGSTTFVIDNLDELKKLQPYRGRVGILLRVSFRSENAKVDLSKKFGCTENEVADIILQAEQLGLHIKGLSFHVGSQCETSDQYVAAIHSCRDMMLELNQKVKAPLSILDIGGGFPADYALESIDILEFCKPIRTALESLPEDWHIYAEPGRYLIAPAVTCVTTIIGKSIRYGMPWYYIDDGVYGSFSGKIFDHTEYPLQVLKEGETSPSVLAGPTCDSIDIIDEHIELPELNIGDLIIGHQMGAYTAATRTRFNLLKEAKFIVL